MITFTLIHSAQMPTVVLFYEIKIELFANDHNPLHVHVKYAEYKCLLTIESATVYAGSMPVKPLRKAVAYKESHREGLMDLWNLLQNK